MICLTGPTIGPPPSTARSAAAGGVWCVSRVMRNSIVVLRLREVATAGSGPICRPLRVTLANHAAIRSFVD
jgi:hypothetical protein